MVIASESLRRVLRPTLANQVLFLLCAMYLILFVVRVSISTAAPLIQSELRLTNAQLGLVFSAFAYPYALFQLVGGWLGTTFGPRRTLYVSVLVVSAATLLTGAVNGLVALLLVRFALGFGEGAAFPTATHAMVTWIPARQWGFAQGITHSCSRIGNAITPPLTVALVAMVSWRGSFVVLGLASVIWVVLWMAFFHDDPRRHPRMTTEELATLPAERHGRPVVPWRRLARRILPVTVVDFCYGWTLWLFLSWIPSFFIQSFHLALTSSALFASGVLFAGVVGDTVGGIVSDSILRRSGNLRRARCGVISAGLFGALVFLVPVVLVHDLTVAALSLSMAFFCAELVVAPIWSVPMDIAPRYAGTASGMMNFGFGLAGIVSPVAFGMLVDFTGSWRLPFLGSIALLLTGALLALRLRPDLPFEQAQGL